MHWVRWLRRPAPPLSAHRENTSERLEIYQFVASAISEWVKEISSEQCNVETIDSCLTVRMPSHHAARGLPSIDIFTRSHRTCRGLTSNYREQDNLMRLTVKWIATPLTQFYTKEIARCRGRLLPYWMSYEPKNIVVMFYYQPIILLCDNQM